MFWYTHPFVSSDSLMGLRRGSGTQFGSEVGSSHLTLWWWTSLIIVWVVKDTSGLHPTHFFSLQTPFESIWSLIKDIKNASKVSFASLVTSLVSHPLVSCKPTLRYVWDVSTHGKIQVTAGSQVEVKGVSKPLKVKEVHGPRDEDEGWDTLELMDDPSCRWDLVSVNSLHRHTASVPWAKNCLKFDQHIRVSQVYIFACKRS